MSPSATETTPTPAVEQPRKIVNAELETPTLLTGHVMPLKLSGALDAFKFFESTPVIGREYVDVDLAAWMRSPNSDALLRDLAIIIAQRGVVFFRKQDGMDNELQKELVQRLGELTGKPTDSGLHIHPVSNAERELGGDDHQISVVSSQQMTKIYEERFLQHKTQTQGRQWHSDITFEPVPSDFTLLRMTKLPSTGGDTLWASGYEVYDRISKPLRSFFDTLTTYIAQPSFKEAADRQGFKVCSKARGSPHNIGDSIEAHHPLIRTNPVTGWRSVFGMGHHAQWINGLAADESKFFLNFLLDLVLKNHDLQVRMHWENINDLAIWDNRCTFHAATPDYVGLNLGDRMGSRSVSVGERPYFDPESVSRREALGI